MLDEKIKRKIYDIVFVSVTLKVDRSMVDSRLARLSIAG
jgi:hypothetical protein